MASRAEALFQQIKDSGDEVARVAFMHKLVSDKTLESEYLDFKNGLIQNNKDDLKKQWSKALSGYANTGGGILIFGIDARKPHGGKLECQSVAPVPRPDELMQVLRDIHLTATDEVVRGVEHLVMKQADGTGFVVSLVPEGGRKPYRAAADSTYYQRTSDSFIVIPHAMLRSMFYPRLRSQIEITLTILPPQATIDNNQLIFASKLRNTGTATARDLILSILSSHELHRADHTHRAISEPSQESPGFHAYRHKAHPPLHPGDQVESTGIRIHRAYSHTKETGTVIEQPKGLEFIFTIYTADQEPSHYHIAFGQEDFIDGHHFRIVPDDDVSV